MRVAQYYINRVPWGFCLTLGVSFGCGGGAGVGATAVATTAVVGEPKKEVVAVDEIGAERPRLVVLLVVDQMRADYLERFDSQWKFGFRQILDNGAVFKNAHHRHSVTITAAGHATLVTGVDPARHGIVANSFLDRKSWRTVGITSDEDGHIVGGQATKEMKSGSAHSAHRRRRSGVLDWLQAALPSSHGVVFALKDRAAVCAGAVAGSPVYWHDRDRDAIVSSSAYMQSLPGWLVEYNDGFSSERWLSEGWGRFAPEQSYVHQGPDAVETESDGQHTVFPHPKAEILEIDGSAPRALRWTPMGQDASFSVLRALLAGEGMGEDEVPDLLVASISSPDYIGHRYGPDSHEIADAYFRLDKNLGDFMQHLDSSVGSGRWTLLLTSDHGVMPLAERIEGGFRMGPEAMRSLVNSAVKTAMKTVELETAPKTQNRSGLYLRFDPKVSALTQREFRSALADALERDARVIRAFTWDELGEGSARGSSDKDGTKDPLFRTFARSFDDERSPDIMIHYAANIYAHDGSLGTSHGSAHDFDTHVPLVVYGAGVVPGVHESRVETVDVAPTLCMALGIDPPDDLDGHSLAGVFSP